MQIDDKNDIIEYIPIPAFDLDKVSRGDSIIISLINKNIMSNLTNVSLSVLATGLIALGVESIKTSLLAGGVEIGLGIVLYVIYEYFPTKTV